VKMPGKGRGMLAKRDFRPGDIIVQETPYATVVEQNAMEFTCSGTLTSVLDLEGAALSRCGGCKSLRSACTSLKQATSIDACYQKSVPLCRV
jgi:hypothetical protein